jgi:predicted phage terminase large subunit-like protein
MPPTGKAMDILLLSVPPQHGKSHTVTETLPSWFLGKHPEDSVIICSYDGTIAEGFSRKNRDKFNEYAEDIFNELPNDAVQGVGLWETKKGGRCRAAGLKAGITSFGAELFIIDDPIKNKEAAQSETIIAKIHGEMGPSVQSRIHPGGKLIVIQTRWIENDVIGYIENKWAEYIWKTINLPCECEDPENDPLGRKLGEALMGEHLGDKDIPPKIRNDNEWLKSKKILVIAGDGEYTWNALYQGHPSAQNGNLFHADWWQLYSRDSVRFIDFDYTCLSVDATFKKTETSDMVAMELWGLRQNHVFLYKLVNKRMGFVDTLARIKKFLQDFPGIDELIIEDKANGSAIIDTLRYSEGVPPIVGVNPLGGKYSRAQAVSPFVSTLVVHIPNDFTDAENREIEWDTNEQLTGTQKFVIQHSKFPFMKHDDMVDADTQALARLIKLVTGEEPMPEKNYLVYNKWYPDMWEDFEQMNSMEQEQFIKTYGAPLEWAPDDYVPPVRMRRR